MSNLDKKPLSAAANGEEQLRREKASERPFGKMNFYFMAVCLLLIITGFLLMLGGGSTEEGGFNPDIFSTRRIVVGPAFTFLGFLLMAFAILWAPNRKSLKRNKTKEENGLD